MMRIIDIVVGVDFISKPNDNGQRSKKEGNKGLSAWALSVRFCGRDSNMFYRIILILRLIGYCPRRYAKVSIIPKQI